MRRTASIEYAARPVRNRVSELKRQIEEVKVQLMFGDPQGYLRSSCMFRDHPSGAAEMLDEKFDTSVYLSYTA